METEGTFIPRVCADAQRAFPKRRHRLIEEFRKGWSLGFDVFFRLFRWFLQGLDREFTQSHLVAYRFGDGVRFLFAGTFSGNTFAVLPYVDIPIVTLFPDPSAHVVVFLSVVVAV